jgi:membrane protein DedA with SNARE-associated domain
MIPDIIFSDGGMGSLVSGILEGIGVPWPGAIIITTAGAEFPGMLNAVILATLFAVTYTLGSAAQYAVGRFGRSLLERLLSPRIRTRLDETMAKYGQTAVLWTRPLAVGNYISIPAGMMRMNPIRFIAYTFLGIWPWAFGMAAAGSLVSEYLDYFSHVTPYVIAAMVVWTLISGGRKLLAGLRTGGDGDSSDK